MNADFRFDIAALVIVFAILFGSCTSSRSSISTIEQHSINNLMQRMDSIVTAHSVVRQDSTWRETILKQFQSIRERNDTSHLIVTDTAGRVIKETIIIRSERVTSSQTDRQEREVLLQRLETMDSTLTVMRLQQQRTDILLQQQKQTEIKEVPRSLTFWQQAQIWLGRLVLVSLAVVAGWFILKKKAWWLKLLRL